MILGLKIIAVYGKKYSKNLFPLETGSSIIAFDSFGIIL